MPSKHRKPSAIYREVNRQSGELADKFYRYYRNRIYDDVETARIMVISTVTDFLVNLDRIDLGTVSVHIESPTRRIEQIMIEAATRVLKRCEQMQKRLYCIGYLGESYFYSTMGEEQHKSESIGDVSKTWSQEKFGAGAAQRVYVSLYKMIAKIRDEIINSGMNEIDVGSAISRVNTLFGNMKRKSREAGKQVSFFDNNDNPMIGVMDQDEIDSLVDEMRQVNQWNNRRPRMWTTGGQRGFEVERDIRTAVMQAVRSGKINAAENLGYSIDDYEWVAVIDSKTCEECCLPRHGLTMTKIKRKFKDETPPPLHFNCRCDLTPVSKEIDEMFGQAVEDAGGEIELGGFEEWLNRVGI
jgi:SPP1 gp7 family putative phage head morphogenesis protein